MRNSWISYARASDFEIHEDGIDVSFKDHRHHRVSVIEIADSFRFRAVVAGPATIAHVEDAPLKSWFRNRAISLVGFSIDNRGRLIGEAWIPKVGLTAEEFRLYVRKIASECDRFEQQLTGNDKR